MFKIKVKKFYYTFPPVKLLEIKTLMIQYDKKDDKLWRKRGIKIHLTE